MPAQSQTAYDLVIKQGDTLPVLTYTMTDINGNAINLTGGSVNFVMRSITSSTAAINASATIVSASAGQVSFTFTSTQSSVVGQYMASFVATLSSGAVQTAPADGYLSISIEDNLTTVGGAQIISLAEAKDSINIAASDKSEDAKLLRMIRGIGPVIEFICGPILLKTVDEWHDGGTPYVTLRQRPVAQIIGASEYVGPVEWPLAIIHSPDKGQIYSCMFEAETGRLVRRTVGGGVVEFQKGVQTVHVTYQAGLSTVPANITQGAIELLRVNFSQTQRRAPGLQALGYGTDDQEPGQVILGFFVPNRVRELLLPNRRTPGIF